MDFYTAKSSPDGLPIERKTSQQTTAESFPSHLEYLRTNNLNKVSESFLNSLLSQPGDPRLGAPASTTFARTGFPTLDQDAKMLDLQKLMEKSHQNPTRSRKAVPKRDRKDWDIAKMALSSTKNSFEVPKIPGAAESAKARRPLNEIVKDSERPAEQMRTTSGALNENALHGLDQASAKAQSVLGSRRSTVTSHNLSVFGKQKDVKENAYSGRSARIKYASVEPISLK